MIPDSKHRTATAAILSIEVGEKRVADQSPSICIGTKAESVRSSPEKYSSPRVRRCSAGCVSDRLSEGEAACSRDPDVPVRQRGDGDWSSAAHHRSSTTFGNHTWGWRRLLAACPLTTTMSLNVLRKGRASSSFLA